MRLSSFLSRRVSPFTPLTLSLSSSFGLATGGAYAEYISVPAGMCTRKPDHVSWVQAAAVPENWLTAWQALFLISEMKKGDKVLIHAGASGVGLAAIQLAKSFDACVRFPRFLSNKPV